MVKLSLSEVKNKYVELINHQISREEADRWAFSFIQKYENNELNFFPLGSVLKRFFHVYSSSDSGRKKYGSNNIDR